MFFKVAKLQASLFDLFLFSILFSSRQGRIDTDYRLYRLFLLVTFDQVALHLGNES